MIKFNYTEFYITNVCNLNCTNCNRFNNFNFSGHTKWRDVEEKNKKWADLLDIDRIGILGGEPMLNPDFLLWVEGLAKLWPSSSIVIITNGTQLSRWPDLYDLLYQYRDRMLLEINCHNIDTKKTLTESIREFLGDCTVRSISQKDVGLVWRAHCPTPDHFERLPDLVKQQCLEQHHTSPEIWYQEVCRGLRFSNNDGVVCELRMIDAFRQSAVIYDARSHALTLHNNDPAKAMSVCSFKKCHHIIKGKLYKCGPVGILPEFVNQFPMDISPEQRDLIASYQPADVDWSQEQLKSFADGLRNATPIPQCSLCTDQMPTAKIKSGTKKITFVKNHSTD